MWGEPSTELGTVDCKFSSFLACVTLGYSLYFLGISKFFWMAILCFDICWTLTHLKKPDPKKFWCKKTVFYFAIGFGIPVVMVSAVIVIDIWGLLEILPDIGTQQCFLTIKAAKVILQHYLLGIPTNSIHFAALVSKRSMGLL